MLAGTNISSRTSSCMHTVLCRFSMTYNKLPSPSSDIKIIDEACAAYPTLPCAAFSITFRGSVTTPFTKYSYFDQPLILKTTRDTTRSCLQISSCLFRKLSMLCTVRYSLLFRNNSLSVSEFVPVSWFVIIWFTVRRAPWCSCFQIDDVRRLCLRSKSSAAGSTNSIKRLYIYCRRHARHRGLLRRVQLCLSWSLGRSRKPNINRLDFEENITSKLV